MRFNRGYSRHQQTFLSLEDQISKRNPVRFMDTVCEDFYVQYEEGAITVIKGQKETGRKAYHPCDLMKILVYGYFNGLSSSRKMERECGRNIELQWLTSNIVPDHKTISDFRKDNGEMVKGLFGYLIGRFKAEGLITGKSVAVDGSKIKAYASQELHINTIKSKLEGMEEQVKKYLEDVDKIDQAEDDIEELSNKKIELEKEIERLSGKKKFYDQYCKQLEESDQKRICTTDREARMMRGRYGKYWGYNVQTAVDTEHHFLTKIEVTDNQNDKGLLAPMLDASEEVAGQKPEEALADGGYYKINEVEKLEQDGTTCFVGINKTPSQTKDQANELSFTYNKEEDRYYCGEGKKLDYWRKKTVDGREGRVYKGIECGGCAIKNICTKADQRQIHRNNNQEWIDTFQLKMNSEEGKSKLIKRRSTVEHPFGTMKYYMGQIPILLKGKKKVKTEMNLYAIGYNLRRYLNITTTSNTQSSNRKMTQAA